MKKKLNLSSIKVTSFTTSIDSESQALKGGLRPDDTFDGMIC